MDGLLMGARELGNPLGNPLGLARKQGGASDPTANAGFFLAAPSSKWVKANGQTMAKSALAGQPWPTFEWNYSGPLTTISTAGKVMGCAYSADGNYMAVALDTTPFIAVYKRSADGYTLLANPDVLPPSAAVMGGSCIAFSGDGTYLAIASSAAPRITIYKRSGDAFTKLADPATLPGITGYSCAFSPDGTHLAVGTASSPYLQVYGRTGDVFTKLANPPSAVAAVAYSVAYSPDGNYLAATTNTTPYVQVFSRTGDTYTKLANPAILPGSAAVACAFSPDGKLLALTSSGGSFGALYTYAGGTLVKAGSSLSGLGTSKDVAFSPDSAYLAVVCDASPYIFLWRSLGDGTLSALPPPAQLVGSAAYCGEFSPDGEHFMVGSLGLSSMSFYGSSQNVTLPYTPYLYLRTR
ncbi:WD40 repeat domain-containing protein [Pseudomonas umsongensis]|uniref:WD40 repeat domain-containing protein n=1 Tax=Pseudomonas umsongensis TaxID=198618 RepID=UPI00200A6DAA|nr:WD40 repeat domain-containing protein [Pseudomonas umsongensis]MCK8685373.1 WD40 repeat domain-containing protein [Pseudomonas umsongensis]